MIRRNRPWEKSAQEPTPEAVYLSRRSFLAVSGAIALGAALPEHGSLASVPPATPKVTPEPVALSHGVFHEFGPGRTDAARRMPSFIASSWQIEVGGLVRSPRTFDLDQLTRLMPCDERIYHFRCVEAWSMVIPWRGFPLHALLESAQPLSSATHVRFIASRFDDAQPGFRWPYYESLRLDEALHDLTYLATGMYGHELAPQHGAPLRLVVPWKYGFKSIKSIARIELTNHPPRAIWPDRWPGEYDLIANVDPTKPHPRWSQSTELPLGESERITTLPFNGYAREVAGLYSG